MTRRAARRIDYDPTPEQLQQLDAERRLIADELPDLIDRNRRAREARQEPTLSGELRRAVHASDIPLIEMAKRAGIAPTALSEFLTGERTLRSDVLDRLAQVLGYELKPAN